MPKRVREQVERILDTGAGKVDGDYEVIVRMRPAKASGDDALLKRLSEAVRKRVMAASPRDVLPARAAALESAAAQGRPTAANRREMAAHGSSLATQAAFVRQLQDVARGALEQLGMQALAPLLDTEIARRGIAALLEASGGRASRGSARAGKAARAPTHLWSANSTLLRVSPDTLVDLPQQVQTIEDIYPNRMIEVPPIVQPARLPADVEDNKASAWGVRQVGALAAWGAYGARGEGVVVGLLDTGVDADHPDLKGKIAAFAEFDRQGHAIPNAPSRDSDAHGTHCAGTIAGGNASGRWIGVAPGAQIKAALVLDGKHGGTEMQVLAGMQWAIESKVDVISMSLGGIDLGPVIQNTYTDMMMNALRLGIPVVAAIGNDGHGTSGTPGNNFFSIAVGATDNRDRAAGFSGGRTLIVEDPRIVPPGLRRALFKKPDLSAPGVAVLSSVPGGKYEAYNGTSMATPHVAGCIALLLSATNIRSLPQLERAFVVQDLLTGSAEELGEAGQDQRFGFGRVDVLRAIGMARDLGYVA